MKAKRSLPGKKGRASGNAALALAACMGLTTATALAADWSDTYIGWRYGSSFAEPYVNNDTGQRQDIAKNIFNLQHTSGFKYGLNFFNVDVLLSNSKDPASCSGEPFQPVCTGSAQEVYIVYRNVLDFAKISGKDLKFGFVQDIGLRWGVDFQSKTDAGYNSKKRMLVAGPNFMIDVPGFLNVSVLALWESNAPCTTFVPSFIGGFPTTCIPRYSYKVHPALDLNWGIPIGATGFSFEGYADIIGSKGTNEFGGQTKTEIHFDGQIMYDVGALVGGPKSTFKVGLEYEYWKNKFGNPTTDVQVGFPGGSGAGPGATAKTPMVRVEYHF